MERTLLHPELWVTTKFISWSPSMKNPLVRVPLPSGKYMTKTIKPSDHELETYNRCKEKRDALGVSLWGERRWRLILSVPSRSVSRPRKQPKGPYNGVRLIHRGSYASYYLVTWKEFDPNKPIINGTRARVARKRTFSFGTPNAKYCSEEVARCEAVAFAKKIQRLHYTVCHDNGQHLVGDMDA